MTCKPSALTNALKHAGGSVVHMSVKADGRNFKMVIADDGRGFDVNAKTADGRQNGLENMRRRAAAVGGQLLVTSEPGKGTRVELTVNFTG